jgi:hypothetical protein
MNVAMLLDMAAEGFGDRIVVGRREDGFTAERVCDLAAGGGQIVEGRIDDTIIRGAENFTCWPELPPTVTGELVRRDTVATLTSARTAQGHDVGGPTATSAATILEGPKAHGE